ncbi:MAG: CYTH domain-containing protein [Eikenella sp.]|nr:CYTH domain-containing protein [Eikenella sp.]
MGIEIERRFLLANNDWRALAGAPHLLRQGYLKVDKACSIRVRISGHQAWLTLKGHISDVSRSEFEYPIPLADAEAILAGLCPFKLEKRRYTLPYQGFVFEIDEYLGENAPLVVAELELPGEDAPYPRPAWLGEEITSHGRYTNAYLSKHPYSFWPSAQS